MLVKKCYKIFKLKKKSRDFRKTNSMILLQNPQQHTTPSNKYIFLKIIFCFMVSVFVQLSKIIYYTYSHYSLYLFLYISCFTCLSIFMKDIEVTLYQIFDLKNFNICVKSYYLSSIKYKSFYTF